MRYAFVFMADCQLGCYATFSGFDDAAVAHYREIGMTVRKVPRTTGFEWDEARFRDAVALTRSLDPAFSVIGGDLVDDIASQPQIVAFNDVRRGIERLWLVPGNHDVAYDATVPTSESLAAYRREFGPDRYTFRQGDDAFIAINTTIWANPQLVPDEHEQQLGFLESSLTEAADARYRIIFGHHPLFVTAHDEPDSYWSVPNPLRSELLELLDRYRTTAFFAGHWHRNGGGRYKSMDMVVTGPVGVTLGDDPSGLRIVEVDDDGLSHRYLALPDERETT